ncbi:DUF5624 domain-containing protein [Legionella hackeliae]|uniref:DUF5624 domain-containing protein n=1 Tax=Legionella hackeliae TaxID=449 RepID=A0A0A8UVP3_LEGHA|nr:DUF5624 domain-containing protein [Legionella hackeliae]KTD13113.1 hypothetical protein Lhac_0982 [Legionella hackeliae]CEK11576.1 conserved exported protein of unknown function [Legionella hackeliae]STX48349.1 Uncharacterised protein [Legionella hackeliae]
MKNHYSIHIITLLFLLFASSTNWAENTSYTTPQQFMNLYFDFTGKDEADFPKSKLTIPDYLIKSEQTKPSDDIYNGPLILLLDSSMYIYDQNRKLVYAKLLRTNRSSGFFEMTAVSHVGPALSYLAKIKQNGDSSWKVAMANLLNDIKQVKHLNGKTEDNWLDRANIKAWQPHKQQIRAMVDYAMSMSSNYILSVQKGAPFDLNTVQQNFLNGNKDYSIPYDSVMVATFMLTVIQSMSEIHDEIDKLHLDWPHAMIVVHNVAGSNVSAGLTQGTNWMISFLQALSNHRTPDNRILIAPYAKVQSDIGKALLSETSYQYYAYAVWGGAYNRSKISKDVFTNLETIYLPERPTIPGDYGYSKASDINDFLVRLKYSLLSPKEMLSNTVGFWVAGEMLNKNWDITKIEIPGLTTGFPAGIKQYPTKNPVIGH